MGVIYYDSSFATPVPKQDIDGRPLPLSTRIEDMEFSELGRGPRVGLGWVLLANALLWGVAIAVCA